MKKILVLLVACILAVSFSVPSRGPDKEINVWNKISTDSHNMGEIVSLNMSEGYSYCEGSYILIVANTTDTEEQVIVMFPNGGYWTAPVQDPFLQELQKEFDSLEDYLRNQKSKEIKKK